MTEETRTKKRQCQIKAS